MFTERKKKKNGGESIKQILCLLNGILVSTPSVVLTTNIINSIGVNNDIVRENIKKDILKNSTLNNSWMKYLYNGKSYSNIDSIVNSELAINPIVRENTISNPDKIIKNFNTSELDGNQIYDLNTKNLVKVYKNSLGKVVLPSCSEFEVMGCASTIISAKQRAINSYINGGLIKPKFSYDRQKWFDDQIEAKKDFQRTTYVPKTSLFYKNGQNFYNSFNVNDTKKLINTFESGYYYDAFNEEFKNDSSYNNLKNMTETFFGKAGNSNTDFEMKFQKNLEQHIKEFINNILSVQYDYKINLYAGLGGNTDFDYKDQQWFWDLDYNFPGLEINYTDHRKHYLEMKVTNKEKGEKLFYEDAFLEALKSDSRDFWTPEKKHRENKKSWAKEIRHFNYKIEGESDKYIKFTLETESDQIHSGLINISGYNTTIPGNIKETFYRDAEAFDFHYVNTDEIFNKFLSVYKIGKLNKTNFLAYLRSKTSAEDTELLKIFSDKNKISLINDFYLKHIIHYLHNEIWTKVIEKIKDQKGPIWSDQIYGSPESQKSVFEADKNFKKSFAKIGNENDSAKDITFDYQGINFKTSYLNWNKNFTPLEYDGQNGQKIGKYYFIQDENLDISEYKDEFGELVASSVEQARDNFFDQDLVTLKKAFSIYDLNGNENFIEAESEDKAIEKLVKSLNLETKLVHKNEIKNLKEQETNLEDLVSDSEHYVYKFKNKQGEIVYYKDYESAKNAYLQNLQITNQISSIQEDEYVYTINKDNNNMTYYWRNENDIEEIVDKIYDETLF